MQQGATQSRQSLSADAMAAPPTALHFPAEDAGPSLAEMAQRDLDAALQLLADRAVYITGSTGAAIALRRSGKNDMLCRASTGANAPELGTLLSTEIGLSGESVRTRRTLRCDDAERDARVNREVCREMGISSVVVMPVVNDDHVLGVFELFSGKVNAFGERDISALQRLSEMVETAVKLAQAALATASISTADVPPLPLRDGVLRDVESPDAKIDDTEKIDIEKINVAVQAAPARAWPAAKDQVTTPTQQSVAGPKTQPVVAPKPQPTLDSRPGPIFAAPTRRKPLFWSASVSASVINPADSAEPVDLSHVPPVLRSLRKCEACGFPVSAGRALCVECEEKKWRGQLRRSNPLPSPPNSGPDSRQGGARPATTVLASPAPEFSGPVASLQATTGKSGAATAAALAPVQAEKSVPDLRIPSAKQAPIQSKLAPMPQVPVTKLAAVSVSLVSKAADESASKPSQKAAPELVLSAAMRPQQSWFSANKYVFGALLVVAATLAAILLLR